MQNDQGSMSGRISMTGEYKYDVAFSFLQQDEQRAVDIADRIRDRVNTFIYSEHQKEVACRDGLDTFTTVFKEEARIVVVLYREGWGRTGFTRVEKDAIKSRWLESEDRHFLVMVALDTPTRAPDWYPSFMIYLDFDRYRIDGAAQLIEARIQEQGGMISVETVAQHAVRLSRKLDFESARLNWRSSEQGFAASSRAAKELLRKVSEDAKDINQKQNQIQAKVTLENESLWLVASGYTLTVAWSHEYSNSLELSGLTVRLFRGLLGIRSEPAKKLLEKIFDADINTAQDIGWRERDGDKQFYTVDQLAATCFEYLLTQLEQPTNSAANPPIIRYTL